MKFVVVLFIAVFGLAIIPKSNSQTTGTCADKNGFEDFAVTVTPHPITLKGEVTVNFKVNLKGQ